MTGRNRQPPRLLPRTPMICYFPTTGSSLAMRELVNLIWVKYKLNIGARSSVSRRAEGQNTMSAETSLPLPDLSIRGFRGFTDLSIPRLGRVTLIAGENNTGKTSILEAIRIFAESGTLEVIREILHSREEDFEENTSNPESSDSDSFLMSALFNGFPLLSETSDPIVVSCCEKSHQIRINIGWFIERFDDDGRSSGLIPEDSDPSREYDSIPALVVEDDSGRKAIYRIGSLDRRVASRPIFSRRRASRVSSRFVSSSITNGAEMGKLWDNISLTPSERHIVEALRIMDPQISAVSMIGEQTPRRFRTAIVSAKNFARRVPLRSYGDGMNRLFNIILALVNTSNGILLIDEFENGMHYTVQLDAWRMIFQLASDLNIQVLATTHSSDCIASFKDAAKESEEEGLLIRLGRHNDRAYIVEYTEERLDIAVRQQIEVR